MRLREDKSSWRARAIIKRDYKHSHDDAVAPRKSKKDTRKWCKGKVGKLHAIAWRSSTESSFGFWDTGECINCKKSIYRVSLRKTPVDL